MMAMMIKMISKISSEMPNRTADSIGPPPQVQTKKTRWPFSRHLLKPRRDPRAYEYAKSDQQATPESQQNVNVLEVVHEEHEEPSPASVPLKISAPLFSQPP